MEGILHIIGAGPGDPELLTIKAFHVLTENTDVVAYPGSAPCTGTAFQIVSQSVPAIKDKEQLPLSFPMSEDPETLSDAHTAAVRQVKDKLDAGKNVSFLTLGDPSIYSTASFLLEPIRTDGYEVRIISGVPDWRHRSSAFFRVLSPALPSASRTPHCPFRIIILQKRKGFGRNSLHAKWLTTSVMIFSRY